ncbi:MAG: electron transfer flavoprotein subunit alpha/FixB family protein [Elusimicrobia bacterium]|nr:electron transfer flavoprotein subunit alpha/FixB family protein [Elusimicrobiota bacterium]
MAENPGKGIWCVAELRHGALVPTIFELLSAARSLDQVSKEGVCAVVLGGPGKTAPAAKEIASRGAQRVFVLEHALLDGFLEEAYARALKDLIEREKPSKILLPASVAGRSLAARLAVACRAGLLGDVTAVALDSSGNLEALRPCYGGNLLATVAVRRGLQMATVRPMAFPRAAQASSSGEVVAAPVDPSSWGLRGRFAGFAPEESKEIDLSSAEKIVSGGRGLGSAKGFELIRDLAHALGAAVGASRAVVDSGWIAYRHQVGLTGRAVRPKLYVACGISGQVQHLAGMSSSDVIVAINSDPQCPMMKLANFAVQGDLHQIIPAVVAEIKKQRG